MYSGENSSNNSFQRIPSNDNLSNGSGSWHRPPSLGNISNSSSNSGLVDTNDNMKTTAIAYLKNLKNPKCKITRTAQLVSLLFNLLHFTNRRTGVNYVDHLFTDICHCLVGTEQLFVGCIESLTINIYHEIVFYLKLILKLKSCVVHF